MEKVFEELKSTGRFFIPAVPFFIYRFVYAGSSGGPPPIFGSVAAVLTKLCVVFKWMFTFGLVIGTIFILIAALEFMTSAGNAEKYTTARKTLLFAIGGIGVALLARGIPAIMASFLGATGNYVVCS